MDVVNDQKLTEFQKSEKKFFWGFKSLANATLQVKIGLRVTVQQPCEKPKQYPKYGVVQPKLSVSGPNRKPRVEYFFKPNSAVKTFFRIGNDAFGVTVKSLFFLI